MGATVSGRGCVLAGDQYSECSPDRSHLNPLMRTSTPQHAPGRRCRRGHHRAHVRNERPTRMLSGQRAHEGAQATTYRANVRISGPRCPISGSGRTLSSGGSEGTVPGEFCRATSQARPPLGDLHLGSNRQPTCRARHSPPQADGHEKSTPEGVHGRNAEPPPVDRTEGGRCAPEGTRTPNLLNRNQMLYPLSYGRFAVWLSISLHASRRDAKSNDMA